MKNTMTVREMCSPSESYARLFSERHGNPYERLADAVICFAIDDYRMALRNDNEGLKRELERFFRSEWGRTLSRGADTEYLMMSIRAEVRALHEC